MDCIFCKIINNQIPSYTIYEDDVVKVFLDIQPDSNGHSLVVPKKHFQDMMDIDNDTLIYIMNVNRKIKKLLEEKLHIDGLTLIQNNGSIQEIKHFHLHLKPYYKEKQEILSTEKVFNILTK
ncbi:MAG: HIT domain-containing protein [Mollicutes bacterium]|nr:HIT domain-containing protein [Mollicutes bacterium]